MCEEGSEAVVRASFFVLVDPSMYRTWGRMNLVGFVDDFCCFLESVPEIIPGNGYSNHLLWIEGMWGSVGAERPVAVFAVVQLLLSIAVFPSALFDH